MAAVEPSEIELAGMRVLAEVLKWGIRSNRQRSRAVFGTADSEDRHANSIDSADH